MRYFKCNGCGKTEETDDNTSIVIHICGSGDVDRICPDCNKKHDFTEQKHCRYCRAESFAKKVAAGEMGFVDAILKM